MSGPGVSVYVLRERLQESWEKRESLRQREEELLHEVLGNQPLAAAVDRSLYDVAIDSVVEGTEGFDTLQSWRNRFLNRP
jgi:hypothetical protein